MSASDLLSELNFVLEFKLPKEISDNQEYIKLSVDYINVPIVEIPVCPIGYKPIPIQVRGEVHCTERYKYIKDVLPLINRWVNSIYCTCSKLNSSRVKHFVEAKLYAYKKDNSLFTKWDLAEFHPLFNPRSKYTTDDIELIFEFENIANKPV